MKKLFCSLVTIPICVFAGSSGRKRSNSIIDKVKTKTQKRKQQKNYKQLQQLHKIACPNSSRCLPTIDAMLDRGGNRILHYLVRNNTTEKNITACLKLGADINTKNANREPAIFFAKTVGMIQFLKKLGANLTIKDAEGNTLLHKIAQLKNISEEEAEKCIDLFTLQDEDGNQIIQLNKQNNAGETPLHLACSVQSPLIILLCKQDVHVNIKNQDGATPIFYLLSSFQEQIAANSPKPNLKYLEYLIALGADVSITNNNNKKPIDMAWHEEVIKMLNTNMPGYNDSQMQVKG